MKLSRVRQWNRRGFTLVELLIVIAIISVLMSLISSAVWKAVVTGNRVRNQNEISQLSTAVENFRQKFGIYPPSRIVLCESFSDYNPSNPLHADSIQFLQTIWPRINFKFPNSGAAGSRFGVGWSGIDWNGDGQLTRGPIVLEGDQCLVFFLGGIPGIDNTNPSKPKVFCSGFSTNPQNPAFHTPSNATSNGSKETIPLFFDFDSTRLVRRTPSTFLSYLDTWASPPSSGTPYAYFSSYKTRNGYNRYYSLGSDCTSLGVWPYAEGPIPGVSGASANLPSNWRYFNPGTFQIISAGRNYAFGQGTNPSPAFPSAPFPFWSSPDRAGNTEASRGKGDLPPPAPPAAGTDDQSNFYDSTLGAGS